MDPVSLGFYASVCGLLGLAGPKLGGAPIRLGVGALVGIVAVTILPHIKTFLGVAEAYSTVSP
ncbi:hypothetical protein TRP8649_04147 [Pelagimonas phthalicica]|uniref:Uncharacterized protein n=1 Tax=Pelagimonas phthalicica TaxID=1037362 RepID=A0A238JIN0_9RHOB|nr:MULTISPECIES: hypothetical protein [Roseobacteraceae]MBO9465720.1 hypothetical protein [Tropicibacter sp. R15_0]TDS89840.1 hypothetical protein CLV87_3892 [Pelagimonas phthalicica]SMX30007.1 hypothetical protein TRP8649_04147 [Pelagimonas phthalicica]